MNDRSLSRRNAFKIAGLAGATAALHGRFAGAEDKMVAAPVVTGLPQGAGFYRTHVGQFEVTVVSDGAFALSPIHPTIGSNASKDAVEGVLKDHFIDPAAVMGQVNAILVRKGDGPYTLIDTGSGKLFGPLVGFLKQNLAGANVACGDVKTVLFTHLHPDHAGGAFTDDGKAVFTNAKHYCHQIERDFWAGENPDLSRSGVGDMGKSLVTAGKGALSAIGATLTTFDGAEHEVSPGITAVLTGGHTPGHCAVRIESDGQSLVYVSDLIVQSVLVPAHPEWFVAFDTDMQKTVGIRQAMFEKLAGDRTLIAGSHLPFPSIGHLKKAGSGFEYVAAPWKWA